MTEMAEDRMNEKIDENGKDINAVASSLRELSVVVQGAHGTNGLKSRVGILEEWREKHMEASADLRKELAHYFDTKRASTCFGIKALDEHLEQHLAMIKKSEDSKAGKVKAFVQTWGQLMQFTGIVIAIIALLMKK